MVTYVDIYATIFIIIPLVGLVIFLSIFIPIFLIRKKYSNFIIQHSEAVKELEKINSRYNFLHVERFNMTHAYDNEIYYNSISCRDYLTYQLVYIQRKVNTAIKYAQANEHKFDIYCNEIKTICCFNTYDIDTVLKNRKRLIRLEKKIFQSKILRPTIHFVINVELYLTTINGREIDYKQDTFTANDVEYLISRINYRKGDFYLDQNIWDSICRVERGKVSNKMRFAIYERDHYRCQICGRKTNDLEIDHIVPISKGGKTSYDNLQTLCHRCNQRKGNKID